MSDEPKDPGDESYEVGYGKPPPHWRFRKGQSGNPGGRPRGMSGGRAMKLVVKEAYRMVRVKEGDRVLSIPALAAVVRSLIARPPKEMALPSGWCFPWWKRPSRRVRFNRKRGTNPSSKNYPSGTSRGASP